VSKIDEAGYDEILKQVRDTSVW